MIKILGTDDSVNSCECCGKSNLKYTVIVEVNNEIMHYGSTCATRHTGMKSSQIKKEVESIQKSTIEAAQRKFHSSIEYLNHAAKIEQLNRNKVKPGKEFFAAQKELSDIADQKKREICRQYSIQMYEFY